MAFGDLVSSAKKNTPQKNVPSGGAENLIEASEGGAKSATQKKDVSYKDSEIKGFIPQQRTFGSRQTSDPKHGSIIRNIASESSMSSQTGGDVNWENCRHRKNSSGRDFCIEYHSLCAKDSCRKARK